MKHDKHLIFSWSLLKVKNLELLKKKFGFRGQYSSTYTYVFSVNL